LGVLIVTTGLTKGLCDEFALPLLYEDKREGVRQEGLLRDLIPKTYPSLRNMSLIPKDNIPKNNIILTIP